jgi:excisionase family DNA binding protein
MEPLRELLTTREAAGVLHVSSRTVTRWADRGRLRSLRTLGGHRRYFEPDVLTLAASRTPEVQAIAPRWSRADGAPGTVQQNAGE